ncbi:MAG: LuxR C-terminal-related transcriptional regulator [Nocardioidaceae bacterium]
MTGVAVFGREDEVARARAGLRAGRVVSLSGPAGIGKSTVGRVVARIEGMTVAGATTSMAAVPRGALLAVLDPDAPWGDGAAHEAVQLARALCSELPAGLFVDDVQWLDDASVPVLQIASRRGLPLLLGHRSEAPLSPAVAELLDPVDHVLIGPLAEADLDLMLEQQLGAPLDGAVSRWFLRLSDGNPQLASDLAATVRTAGALVERHGFLTADAPLPVGGSVAEAARGRLAAAPSEARDLVALLSLEEPLDLAVLRSVSSLDAADVAERSGLVRLVGEPPLAWLGHPVYGEVAAADMTGAERVRGYESLVRAAGQVGGVDPVRRARWALAAGIAVPPEELLAVARLASPPLAERFLRQAIAVGAGLPATLALAGLLGHIHRGEEAVALLAEARTGSPEEEVQLAATRAFALSFGPQRTDEALVLLAEAEQRLGPHPLLLVARASALFRGGRTSEARRLAGALFSQPLPPAARAQAGLTLQTCLLHLGEIGAAQAMTDELGALTRACAADLPEGPGAASLLATWSHRLGGDLAREGREAERGYVEALEHGDEGERGQFAQVLGYNHVSSGRPVTGCRLLRESLAGRGVWLDTTRPWVLSLLTQGQVLAGDLRGARAGAEELRGLRRTRLHDGDVALAEAAVLAATGDRRRAVDLLLDTAGPTFELGHRITGLQCWHDALRYGSGEAGSLLLRHAPEIDSGWAGAYTCRAQARTGHDLEAAAAAWAGIGHVWFAAETLTAAVRWHRSRRAVADAVRAQLTLRELLVGTEPMAGVGDVLTGLTDREGDVVALAVTGLSDREIAERLGISVRTVQTHLSRSYAKLGVRSRRELGPPGMLSPP